MSMKIEQTTIYANLKQSLYTDVGFDIIGDEVNDFLWVCFVPDVDMDEPQGVL